LNLFCNNAKGIGRSTPRVSFFATRAERAISLDNFQKTSMNSSAYALPHAYARGLVEGQLAGERDDGSLRFINTDHTARDMLRIVQAHGLEKIQYWRFFVRFPNCAEAKSDAQSTAVMEVSWEPRSHQCFQYVILLRNFRACQIIVHRTMSVGWLLTV
jgi:hypothetical protein